MPAPVALFDIQPLLPALQRNELILSPNQRMASRIRAAYAIAMKQQGVDVIETPRVFSFTEWQQRCYNALLLKAYPPILEYKLLSASQERNLWQQIVAHSDLGAALLKPAATAQRAASAYQLLVEWQQAFSLCFADVADHAFRDRLKSDEDAAELLAWIDEFERRCQQYRWLPVARRAELLITAFNDGVLDQEPAIMGVHFEDMPPLHSALVASAGRFYRFDPQQQSGNVAVVDCESYRQEITAAALWAKQRLAANAESRVAIVVPELSQQRAAVERILRETFSADYKLPGAQASGKEAAFNMSAGYPLSEAPVVAAALNALGLAAPKLPLECLQDICRSPFYCLDETDMRPINQLLRLLSEQGQFEISGARFRYLADQAPDADQPWHFSQVLQQLADLSLRNAIGKKRKVSEWLPLLADWLAVIGWPGKRTLNSIEYQQVSQWQQSLLELQSLDAVSKPLNFSEFLSELRSVLATKIFQAQTTDSRLQVLGVLEAVGLSFSDLWLCSMSEQTWPNAPSPHPLLPAALQRELAMPHASAERELIYASQISEKLRCSAEQVVVSFPTVVDDNPSAVSSLFRQHKHLTLNDLLAGDYARLPYQPGSGQPLALEQIQAGNAPPLTNPLQAGTALLASQSACPFVAFARYRLKLNALPEPESGLSALDRGNLLHYALENFWQPIKTRQQLLDLSEQQLTENISRACDVALTEFIRRSAGDVGEQLLALESKRMRRLMQRWLEKEKNRQDFTVRHLEHKMELALPPLTLSMRIDRIDELADGSLLVIDYKTGLSNINRWWTERPDEPQLPAYNMLLEAEQQKVSGIAFAELRADQVALKGVADQDSPEISLQWQDKHSRDSGAENWQQQQQQWQAVIQQLAEDFANGEAAIDPKPGAELRLVDYAPLLRTGLQFESGAEH